MLNSNSLYATIDLDWKNIGFKSNCDLYIASYIRNQGFILVLDCLKPTFVV